ncbi:MAG: hypothetical protein HPY62_03625 [Bacteroidales bacterium]|nr:hypothetical protein [Bacteroidales bacterium]
MKTQETEKINAVFSEFELTVNEMMSVRGGDEGEPILLPNPPRIII